MEQARKGKPPRLERIFQSMDAPVFFVTFNTHGRQRFLADPVVHSAFREYCARAGDHDVAVGKYVLMPDHVHLFVCFGSGSEVTLSDWMKV